MRGMILAAGRGERMGVLTRSTPKPLLRVGNHYLIEYSLFALQHAGIEEVVINVSYLGEQIIQALGDGKRYNMEINYSFEPERLETGGGIRQALSWLGRDPFVVLSADVICDYQLVDLPQQPLGLAHLVMIPNPDFHRAGDFGLNGLYLDAKQEPKYTFANIGVYRPELFSGVAEGHFPLSELLLPAMRHQQVTGELYKGLWFNVGNEQQLTQVTQFLQKNPA